MKKEEENKILADLEKGYDLVAEKFSATRKFFWRDFDFLKEYINDNDCLLDFGCGNGRLREIMKDKKVDYFGADVSRELIRLAQKRYPEARESFFKISRQASLPFKDNFFNKIFSLAVFHHFPPKTAKFYAGEIWRIMRRKGILVVTCWNLEQEGYAKFFSLKNSPNSFFKNKKDVYLDFRDNRGNVFRRYHHIYSLEELKEIFSSVGFEIEHSFCKNEKNLILILKKG